VNYARKSKIELQWSHITALKAICQEDEDGILDLVVLEILLQFVYLPLYHYPF
jgi:hypothetical protein